MQKELSVTQYCEKFDIARHAVHRRIKKFEATKGKELVNNIIGIERIGPKIIVIKIDTKIKFKKK